jgi:hypothetical protein
MWPFKRREVQVYVPPPRSPGASAALAALRSVPGPSPWYLNGTVVPGKSRTLRWRSAGDPVPLTGKSVLVDDGGRVVAVADFHCYVRTLGERQLLVWYTEEHGEGASLQRDLRLRIFDIDALRSPIDVKPACAELGSHSRFYASSGEVATIALSTALEDGMHSVAVPPLFRDAGELLILVDSTAAGRCENHFENHFDEMHVRLWALDLAEGRLEIVPQDWFNHGAYDFGYQWVTRMARLPGTGDIVGEGIRLGIFRLDGTKKNIAEWLAEDIFYQPEPSSE